MHILIFRTDIQTEQKVDQLTPVFHRHPDINEWSIDLEDVDKVLRIEATDQVEEEEIIELVINCGFFCEELPD